MGGDLGDDSDPPPQVGLLGATFTVTDGHYQIASILHAPNWHAELRAPLAEPGVDANVGDWLLAVNGQQLDATVNLFSAFEMTAGRQVTLTLSSDPDVVAWKSTREVTVVALSGAEEQMLRQWAWVEERRLLVEQLSEGKLGYIYMPNTSVDGYTAFNRGFYSQIGKQGLVIDERTNGGGFVADYVLDMLARYHFGYFNRRDHRSYATPRASILGPKVMIINALSGSGARVRLRASTYLFACQNAYYFLAVSTCSPACHVMCLSAGVFTAVYLHGINAGMQVEIGCVSE